jgi:hypothetical protein
MRRILCALLWYSMQVPVVSFGQLTETDTVRLNMLFSLNGNLTFGNVDRILVFTRADAVLTSQARKWVFKTQNNYRYGTIRSNRTESDFAIANYIYHQPFKKVYPFVMASYESSLIKKMRHRIGGGFGMTFVPVKNKTSLLKLSVTAFFDRTIYDVKPIEGAHTDSHTIDTVRPAVRIYGSHHWKETLTFYYELIDQISISKSGNHRLIGAAGFDYALSKILDLILRLNYSREDLIAPGVTAYDWFFTFGISLHYQQ